MGRGIAWPVLVREGIYQPVIAKIEREVGVLRVVDVRLLEHERYAEDILPKIDRRLPAAPTSVMW